MGNIHSYINYNIKKNKNKIKIKIKIKFFISIINYIMSTVIDTVTTIVSEPEFAVNMAMRTLILFSFLSTFFAFYVTKLSKEAFNEEIIRMMDENFGAYIKDLKDNSVVKQVFDLLPLDKFKKIYSKPEKAVEIHNDGLFTTVLVTNLLLWASLIAIIYIVNESCDKDIDIKEIATENAIIFIFIGMVELLFFKMVTVKFVSVTPSFISQQFLDKVQKLF
jgi:hypothetical protein